MRTQFVRQRRVAAPCNPGGGSPSMHRDKQRLTGAIMTVRGNRLGVRFPVRIRRIETRHLGGLAGVDRSSPEHCTKVQQPANSPRRCRHLHQASWQRRVAAPCKPGGGSPPMHRDKQRLTGAITTVRGDQYRTSFPVRIRRIVITSGIGLAGVDRSGAKSRTKVNPADISRRCLIHPRTCSPPIVR